MRSQWTGTLEHPSTWGGDETLGQGAERRITDHGNTQQERAGTSGPGPAGGAAARAADPEKPRQQREGRRRAERPAAASGGPRRARCRRTRTCPCWSG